MNTNTADKTDPIDEADALADAIIETFASDEDDEPEDETRERVERERVERDTSEDEVEDEDDEVDTSHIDTSKDKTDFDREGDVAVEGEVDDMLANL